MGRIIAPLNFPLVLLDNLIAFWNLDETSGTRYDSSGNGRNLTQTFGTVSSTTGKIKNCAYFNGINGGGSTNSKLGSTSFGVNPNSNFSMSVWIKPRSFSSYQHIIGAPFQNGFYIGANNSNLTFNLYNGTVYGVSAPSTALNTWHHYVFIREGSTLKLYADNVYIGSASITGQSFPGASVFSVGGGEYNEYYFNGDIDALGLWTRVLTESEIGTLYNNGNGKQYIDNKISIKKQNQTKLEPYSIDGGSTVYDANNIYIFKGGSINTLGVIFDLTPANTIGSADIIYFNGNSYYKKTGGFIAAGWRDQNSITTDRSNTVIDPGTLIYFNPRSYKTTAVEVGAIIEKYNSPAKISLRPTCGYQNTNKLIELSGNDAPNGVTFNNIAFDYSSFASSCSSLGLDPTTILNSLGGVDFNYNYVVIRAKTSSNFTSDSISDLGNGVINITTIGPSTGTVANRYRFFVMCKTGWKIVRFYGTDYNI
jgi:hypothetical protein